MREGGEEEGGRKGVEEKIMGRKEEKVEKGMVEEQGMRRGRKRRWRKGR